MKKTRSHAFAVRLIAANGWTKDEETLCFSEIYLSLFI